MTKEETKILLLSIKCLIYLYSSFSSSEYEEVFDPKRAAKDLLEEARQNKVVIPKKDRILLYSIIKSA